MKNHQELTLLFWHRKSKLDKKGHAPIFCRISIEEHESEEISFGAKAHINEWDVKNKKAKGGEGWKQTNLKIKELEVDLRRIFIGLQASYELITPLMVKIIPGAADIPAKTCN